MLGFLLFLIFSSFTNFLQALTNPLPPSQFNALYDLYNSTNGLNWHWETGPTAGTIWNFSNPNANPCADNWQGITCGICDSTYCNLYTLLLHGYNLTGTLPASIGAWNQLETIDLSSNQLYGSIPNNISSWTSIYEIIFTDNLLSRSLPAPLYDFIGISYLYLANNAFTGTVSGNNWRNLFELELGTNFLYGPFSDSFFSNWQDMRIFSCPTNLFSSSLPSTLGDVNKLDVLEIDDNYLNGSLPANFGDLKNLDSFYGNINHFTGVIPKSLYEGCVNLVDFIVTDNYFQGGISKNISNLQLLENLYLDYNDFTSTLPSNLGVLTALTDLYLDENQFQGSLPITLGGLTSLIELSAAYNQFTNTIPTSIVNCLSLKIIYLEGNSLNGSLPNDIGNLQDLEVLSLSENSLTGTLPNSIQYWTKLDQIYLDANKFSGTIPEGIMNWQKVTFLDFDVNHLNGTLPAGIGGMTALQDLYLEANHFSGSLPASIVNLGNLEIFDASFNNISGKLPNGISNWQDLTELDLSNNKLTGSIPTSIGSLKRLEILVFDYNNLNGNLPEELFQLPFISEITLSSNNFSGTISPNISNWQVVIKISFAENSFTGSIPSTIGELKQLTVFFASQNFLTGPIPDGLYDCISLTGLFLGFNQISSTLSDKISNLKQLEYFDLSKNNLHGSLPSAIGNLRKLQKLIIYENSFTGTIPTTVGNLTNLNYFYAAYNQLFGSLPTSFSSLISLTNFDISFNMLTGSLLPLKSVEIVELTGNSFHGYINPITFSKKLKTLVVQGNFFHGNLSVIESQCLLITNLDTSLNSFTGTLPYNSDWSLTVIYDLGTNFLTGSIVSNLSTLDALFNFAVGNNFLTGTVPSYFFNKSVLSGFNVSFNLLSGSIVTNVDSINGALEQVVLNSNFLTGTLPPNLGNYATITILNVYDNQFTSTIPQSYQNLPLLETFLIYNNHFSGNIAEVLTSLPELIGELDLSNNEFTGSLPYNYFQSNGLISFAAGSNCLSGSLPESLCDLPLITVLALDGLTSAGKCQHLIFPHFFDGFTLEKYLTGSIPECLFAMPLLETLHLSGNGFTGSLSSSLIVSGSLNDLSLSHNAFSGTIPTILQEREWYNFDLSYNKFSGTLSSSFFDPKENSTVTLEVNQLSGSIPIQLQSANHINILNGNIFSCENQDDLPKNDPNYNNYSCGSNTVNDLLYSWLAIYVVLLILLPISLFCIQRPVKNQSVKEFGPSNDTANKFQLGMTSADNKATSSLKKLQRNMFWINLQNYLENLKNLHGLWNKAFDDISQNNKVFSELGVCFQQIRSVFMLFSVFSLFILLPIYGGLSSLYKTHEISYAWIISGILLTGETAAIVLFVLFLSCFASLYLFSFYAVGSTSENSKQYYVDLYKNQELQFKEFHINQGVLYCAHFLLFLLDTILMGAADVAYIIVVLNYSSQLNALVALTLALGRILMSKLLWFLLPLIIKSLGHLISKYYGNEISEAAHGKYNLTVTSVLFLQLLIFFNNIILPTLAILIILPDCFYNAFKSASAVDSSYKYNSCDVYYNVFVFQGGEGCYDKIIDNFYSPPFIYSFSCASNIIMNYIPVYINNFLLIGVLFPVWNLLLKYWYDKYHPSPSLRSCVTKMSNMNENSSDRLSSIIPDGNGMLPESSSISHAEISLYSNNNMEKPQTSFQKKIFSFADYWIPTNMKYLEPLVDEVSPHPNNDKSSDSTNEMSFKKLPTIFSKSRFVIELSSYFIVLISFGILFPPLIIIGTVALLSRLYFEKLFMGRILYESKRLEYPWYEKKLEYDCQGVHQLFLLTWKPVLIIASFLFAYIIFDTWGDAAGWKSALPLTFLMAFLPILFTFIVEYVFSCLGKSVQNVAHDSQRDSANNRLTKIYDRNSSLFQVTNPIHSPSKSKTSDGNLKNEILENA